MEKRYQVFVSSTFEDLKEERKAVIECLLNAKYIPAGMELFSASNDEQFEYIKKIIDTCDYYVLIVAARYGSINPTTGKSFTEQEYDYAASKGIPILTFLHRDPYNLPYNKREDDKRELLEQFKEKVSGRLFKMWSNLAELTASVVTSLNDQVKENPQKGWIRYDPRYFSADNEEIEQLNKENIELKKEIASFQSSVQDSVLILDAREKEILVLKKKNDELIQQLEETKKIYEYQQNLKTPIQGKVTIHFNNSLQGGVIHTTWLEILYKTKGDLIEGRHIQYICDYLSDKLVFGKGEIISVDVQKIFEYMIGQGLWKFDGKEVTLSLEGVKILKEHHKFYDRLRILS